MNVVPTELAGVVIIEPRVFRDARGFFFESYHAARYADAGIRTTFVQDNHSSSVKGTIRGLHYQLRHPQAKLLRVISGAVLDVAVDIRRGSPTFGRWVGVDLSAENKRQLYIPAGFGHGFCVTSDVAELEYKCSDVYVADDQHGVLWNDPTIGITWPVREPILSDSDRAYRPLTLDRDDLPAYRP
ncbi:MAG TPA: dTDP-4-dehydrorhamnose 3,5-epimerase [Gemmatimonadales bacterium]|nr:dTDP-4-dehydrorhamnose 3,5-epimerase [Gemmatimonadales bacterium]